MLETNIKASQKNRIELNLTYFSNRKCISRGKCVQYFYCLLFTFEGWCVAAAMYKYNILAKFVLVWRNINESKLKSLLRTISDLHLCLQMRMSHSTGSEPTPRAVTTLPYNKHPSTRSTGMQMKYFLVKYFCQVCGVIVSDGSVSYD